MEDDDAVRPGVGPVAPEVVKGELRDFLRAHERRRRQMPRAIVVGAVSGLVAVAFSATLGAGEALRTVAFAAARECGVWGVALTALWGAVGAGAAVVLVRRFAPEASGSGIPHLKAVLHHLRPMRAVRLLGVKFAGGVAAVTGGLALGREGPTIQMGGAVGQLASR